MSALLRERLRVFREKAAAQGFPAEDVERWAAVARPCVTVSPRGDGPVVGRFGGPLLLPADAPDPEHPYIATLDLAAFPAEESGLPLPSDGHLLLFTFPEEDDDWYADLGSAAHVPAGTPVVERDKHFSGWSAIDEFRTMIDEFPLEPLRATADVSLPRYCDTEFPEDAWEHAQWPPYSAGLINLLRETVGNGGEWGILRIGGYAEEESIDSGDPLRTVVHGALEALKAGKIEGPVSADLADWVLLADWHTDISTWHGATIHWGMQREDLVSRRFDRVFATRYWNP